MRPGRPIDNSRPDKRPRNFNLAEPEMQNILELAELLGTSASVAVAKATKEYLEERTQPEKKYYLFLQEKTRVLEDFARRTQEYNEEIRKNTNGRFQTIQEYILDYEKDLEEKRRIADQIKEEEKQKQLEIERELEELESRFQSNANMIQMVNLADEYYRSIKPINDIGFWVWVNSNHGGDMQREFGRLEEKLKRHIWKKVREIEERHNEIIN